MLPTGNTVFCAFLLSHTVESLRRGSVPKYVRLTGTSGISNPTVSSINLEVY